MVTFLLITHQPAVQEYTTLDYLTPPKLSLKPEAINIMTEFIRIVRLLLIWSFIQPINQQQFNEKLKMLPEFKATVEVTSHWLQTVQVN